VITKLRSTTWPEDIAKGEGKPTNGEEERARIKKFGAHSNFLRGEGEGEDNL